MSFFLLPGAKFAQKLDVSTPLFETLRDTRGESAAASCITACRAFGELRVALHEPPTTTITRVGIKKYLTALHVLLTQVQIPVDIGVPFLWNNAFDANDSCRLNDIRIDIICSLFNLAVCEATLADVCYRQKRTDPNAMKKTLQHFQVAAGYFHLAQQQPTPYGIRVVTSDLYPASLRALEKAMLANAQQVLREMAIQSGYQANVVARFAIGARDLYTVVEDACKDGDIVNTAINAYVGRPAAALAAYLDAVAQADQARSSMEQHDMPQQLTRLTNAKASVRAGLTDVNGLETSSLAVVEKLKNSLLAQMEAMKTQLYQQYEEADEANRTIYFCTAAPTVPDIVSKQLVTSSDVRRVFTEEELHPKLDALLKLPAPLAPEMTGLAATYTDMVAKTVADEVAIINTTGSKLKETITRLEGAIRTKREEAKAYSTTASISTSSSLADDRKAIDVVQAAKDGGGMKTLRELQSQVANLSGETISIIQSIENLLNEEDIEDRQLRAHVQVSRPSSAVLTQTYWQRLTRLKTNLSQAGKADHIIASQIDKHDHGISQLEHINVLGFTPPSAMPQVDTRSRLSSHIETIGSDVKDTIHEGTLLLTAKYDIVQELEKKKSLENAIKVITGIPQNGAEMEAISNIIEREYGPFQKRVQTACKDMQRVEELLLDAEARLHHRPVEEDKRQDARDMMNEVYRHQTAALKFSELLSHLRQGANFYAKEQDNLIMLKRDIEGFVAARSAEAKDLSSRPQHHNVGYPSTGLYPSGTSNPYSNNPYPPPPPPGGPSYPGGGHLNGSWRQ